MKRQLLTYLIIFTNIFLSYGQGNIVDCLCPHNTYVGIEGGTTPDTIFTLSDRNKISLCGPMETINNEIYYSEFLLRVCGQDLVLEFSDATQTYKLSILEDTLRINEIVLLATGINRSFEMTDWGVQKYYFSNGQLVKTYFEVNQSIRKYTKHEINETLKEYEIAKAGSLHNPEELAHRLFISAISGDEKSREYFEEFEFQFGELDGGVAEEYKDLQAMLPFRTPYNISQVVQLYENESPEQFVTRVKPDSSILTHKVIEANWNKKPVIIALYDQRYYENYEQEAHRIIATISIQNGYNLYDQILIDTIDMEGGAPKIESVFFANADKDIENELIIIASWEQRHYEVSGVLLYGTFVFDDLLPNSQTKLNFLKGISEKLDGGCECSWRDGTIKEAKFNTVTNVLNELKRIGLKQ